jgi:murein DD-endopeptidase MepM/ murein hydrolase activator NlpD
MVCFILFALLITNPSTGLAQDIAADLPTPTGNPNNGEITSIAIDPIYPSQVFPTPTPQSLPAWNPPLVSQPYALGQYEHFYLSRPIGSDSVNWPIPTYLYGNTDVVIESAHSGVDFAAPLDTPIMAGGSGKVVFAGYGLALGKGNVEDPYGIAVVIRHDFSYYGYTILTVYAHMNSTVVVEGQTVEQGQIIGYVGNTGNTTGPHVHYEVRLVKDDVYYVQNPVLWMSPSIDHGVFVGAFLNKYGTFLNNRDVWITSKTTGEVWKMKTYYAQATSNDPFYSENLVLGDLDVGEYEIMFLNNYIYNKYTFTIQPGAITYIRFKSGEGFSTTLPDASELTGFFPPTGN